MSGEDAPRPYLENLIVPEIKTNKQQRARQSRVVLSCAHTFARCVAGGCRVVCAAAVPPGVQRLRCETGIPRARDHDAVPRHGTLRGGPSLALHNRYPHRVPLRRGVVSAEVALSSGTCGAVILYRH
jgi:hypothetical protein